MLCRSNLGGIIVIHGTRKQFEKYKGRPVTDFVLENERGTEISVLDFGAIWHRYALQRRNGRKQNVLLNTPSIEDFIGNPFYIGASIGRVTGRISKGTFSLNQQKYQLDRNEGTTTLHGGPHGFAYLWWNGEIVSDEAGDQHLEFTRVVDEAVDSFPGELQVKISYYLGEDDKVLINYEATASQDTLFSPTCHAYFNLNEDQQLVTNHEVKANIQAIQMLDENHVPNGQLARTRDSVYDFQQYTYLSDSINQIIAAGKGAGLDDTFLCESGTQVRLRDKDSQLALNIASDRKGVTLFTANGFDETMKTNKGNGCPYLGIAIEPQILSNAINYPNLGDMTIKGGESKNYWTSYQVHELE